MKLSIYKQEQLDEAYDTLIQVCLYDRPLEDMAPLLADDVMNFGAGKKEITKTKEAFLQQIRGQKELAKGITMNFNINPVLRKITNDGNGAIYTDDIINTVWINDVETELKFRLSFIFEYRENKWMLVHSHTSAPDSQRTDDEIWPVEELKKRTAILEKSLDEKIAELEIKNRELQIEAALERVRTEAMSIQKSGDLSAVSKIIFTELDALGFSTLRNTEIIINEDQKESILSYYYSDDGITGTIEVAYNQNPVLKNWATEMKKASDAFVAITIPEGEIDAWRKYREDIGYMPDPKLNDAKTVFYYSYSIGLGALSVSSWQHLNDEELKMLERFRNVFGLAYRRYADVTKAALQAREAMIEVCLERTRTQSMMMQHSEQLDDTLRIFHEQVLLLGIKSAFSFLWLPDEKNERHIFWATWAENDSSDSFATDGVVFKSKAIDYPLDRTEPATAQCLVDWKGSESIVSYHIQPSGVAAYFAAWQELIAGVEQLKPEYFSDGLYYIEAFITYGCFGVMVKDELSAEEKTILLRFAVEFERTYTRFLDLQKAEANAREARIEASLERIRSRAMAMRKTEELLDAADLVGKELTALGIESMNVSYAFVDEGEMSASYYSVNPIDGKILPFPFVFPHTETDVMVSILSSWKNQEALNILELNEAATLNHQTWIGHHIRDLFDKKGIAFSMEEFLKISPKKAVISTFNFTNGYLFTIGNKLLSESQKDILLRVTKVFDLTYRRFLDLKQAEAQAKEAQIEAALERVRSRSMAMQKSEELKDVIQIVYDQFLHLNIPIEHTGFVVDYQFMGDWHFWIADRNGTPAKVTVPNYDAVWNTDFNYAKQQGLPIFTTHLDFEEKNKFYEKLLAFIPDLPEDAKEFYFSCPGMAASTVLFENTALYIENFSGYDYSEEENSILIRFGRVFEQAYARFLDLQKAEEQARESHIQLALERVRARTMAMQQSNELPDAANLLFQQVQSLGMPTWSAGYCLWADNKNAATFFMSSEGVIQSPITMPLTEDPTLRHMRDGSDSPTSFYVDEIEGEVCSTHYDYMRTLPGVREVLQSIIDSGFPLPTHQINHMAYFPQGFLLFITYQPVPEAHDIFKRFARVFEQTYTRFLDLQRAEAQGLEAIKRASVDRVRAEIASMRTSMDLEKITPLIWNELLTLEVPFIRCGVFIMDEENEQVNTYLSTPEGKAIAAFHQPFDSPGEIKAIVGSWQKKQMYKQHWDEARFTEFASGLVAQGAISPDEKYITENHPTDLYLHFIPFLQGMLYVGNTAALEEGDLQLVQNLADAFSTAYARYEDFNKLEAAKEQVDKTLFDLKQAQAQLVQAEKMASLGELTAGIAHEIQNPLNFVNNFSELSNELISEMEQEMDKGNRTEAKQIAEDIRTNLEKINLHGKRADSIVKGMLQHSRTSSGEKQPTDINALADEYLRLAYHGLRAKDKAFNATLETDFDQGIGKVNIIPQDIGRVLLNLISNAFYAVDEKKKSGIDNFEPTVAVNTKMVNGSVEVMVRDNGNGIPQKVIDKIFQPFFTTKPTGQGTGLGLSLAYDIVKAHGGEIKVETKDRKGSCFIINIPIN
jgi:signal transduction histidine kinase